MSLRAFGIALFLHIMNRLIEYFSAGPGRRILHSLGAGLLLLAFAPSCTWTSRQYARYFPKIEHVSVRSGGLIGIRRIALSGVQLRNVSYATVSADNFTDNLQFHLREVGFGVQRHTPREETFVDENTGLQARRTVALDDPGEIAAAARNLGAQLFITGYVFEQRTGTLLEEETSIGVLLNCYDSSGELAAQLRFIGSETLDSYENSARVAQLMAEELADLASSN